MAIDRDGPGASPDRPLPELGRRLRDGRLTSRALTDAHLARIAARDPGAGAFVHVCADRARELAERADAELAAGTDRGPLHGVPFAVKDLFDTAGIVTTYGSRRRAAHVPDADAALVARALDAGAVLLGKLATYEYALDGPTFDGAHPPPRNPWDPARVTGGSSSGSAAAVAAGLVRFALGTDTGGSVRSPACHCGVVGLKPSFGALPLDGCQPLSPSLDHAGVIAATVEEAGIAFEALADGPHGRSPGPPGPPAGSGAGSASGEGDGLAGLRIGYARSWFADDPALEPEVLVAMDAAASLLSLLGARVALVELPDYAPLEALGARLMSAEAFRTHRDALAGGGHGYGRRARAALLAGRDLSVADRDAALDAAAGLRRLLDDGPLAAHDALLTVGTLAPAPTFAELTGEVPVWTPMRTLPFNLTGHPALAVPIDLVDGLPVGMQLVGRAGDEALLCRIGTGFERATAPLAGAHHRPP